MTDSDITIVGQGSAVVTPYRMNWPYSDLYNYKVEFFPANGWKFSGFSWTIKSTNIGGGYHDSEDHQTTENPYLDGDEESLGNWTLLDGWINVLQDPDYSDWTDIYTISNAVATFVRIDGEKGIIYSPTRGNAIVYDTGTLRPMCY